MICNLLIDIYKTKININLNDDELNLSSIYFISVYLNLKKRVNKIGTLNYLSLNRDFHYCNDEYLYHYFYYSDKSINKIFINSDYIGFPLSRITLADYENATIHSYQSKYINEDMITF
jgi:hypothetical protein